MCAVCSFSGFIKYSLAGGLNKNEGRVEMTFDGSTYTVCNYGWNSPDASVICKQMGFMDGSPVK